MLDQTECRANLLESLVETIDLSLSIFGSLPGGEVLGEQHETIRGIRSNAVEELDALDPHNELER